MVLTNSGNSVAATWAVVASPVAIAFTFLAIFRPAALYIHICNKSLISEIKGARGAEGVDGAVM